MSRSALALVHRALEDAVHYPRRDHLQRLRRWSSPGDPAVAADTDDHNHGHGSDPALGRAVDTRSGLDAVFQPASIRATDRPAGLEGDHEYRTAQLSMGKV
ncbi:MAG: hypothetical protein JO281_04475 [Pseudonocardiales bacterium]|nr:hypothetical protein [Pseudonocardiales bacterium]